MVSKKALLSAALVFVFGGANAIEMVNRPYTGSGDYRGAAISSPVQASPVATPVAPRSTWTMDVKDINYYGAFQRWANTAGYQVRWDADKHFIIEAVSSFPGTFEEAVTNVLSNPAVVYSKYPLEVCFYPNTPPLARITRKGVQEKECQ